MASPAPPRRWRRRAGALVCLLLAGCGYRYGLSLPQPDTSVGVRIFANDSRLITVERDLHEALSASLSRRLDAALVTPERADLVVEGEIRDFSRRAGIRTKDNKLAESGVRFTVAARLVRPGVEGRPSRVLSRTQARARSGYSLLEGTLISDTPEELSARVRALRNLSDQLVLDLFTDLDHETSP